jgi:hypothetical protein
MLRTVCPSRRSGMRSCRSAPGAGRSGLPEVSPERRLKFDSARFPGATDGSQRGDGPDDHGRSSLFPVLLAHRALRKITEDTTASKSCNEGNSGLGAPSHVMRGTEE